MEKNVSEIIMESSFLKMLLKREKRFLNGEKTFSMEEIEKLTQELLLE